MSESLLPTGTSTKKKVHEWSWFCAVVTLAVLAAIIFGVVIGWEFRIRNFDDIEPYPNTPRRTVILQQLFLMVDLTVPIADRI